MNIKCKVDGCSASVTTDESVTSRTTYTCREHTPQVVQDVFFQEVVFEENSLEAQPAKQIAQSAQFDSRISRPFKHINGDWTQRMAYVSAEQDGAA